MPKDQQYNNRSQGQRIRRTREDMAALVDTVETTSEVVAQHDRDLKFLKARVSELEQRETERRGGFFGRR